MVHIHTLTPGIASMSGLAVLVNGPEGSRS